jgi:glycerophosphoryl diester phosphodiesterase
MNQIKQTTESRPFYVIRHNPNTIDLVEEALNAGANGIEPDVNVYSDRPDELCISHLTGDSDAPALEIYLTKLREITLRDQRLCLVVFDCKSATATPAFGLQLLQAIRTYLTRETTLNIIISVSAMEHAIIFDQIGNMLGPREGLMIDEHRDPVEIAAYFQERGIRNQCYGNGISIPPIAITGPNVTPSMERACALRAATGIPTFICPWTVNEKKLGEEMIRTGVDGMICDDTDTLLRIIHRPEYRHFVRLAVRNDNPFMSSNAAYSLTVYTADSPMAGTDAEVTFTLKGSKGSAQTTLDTSFRARMERNHVNYLILQAPDLGDLISVSVQRDDKGNAPDWWLDKIEVQSAHYKQQKTAVFNCEIKSVSPVSSFF